MCSTLTGTLVVDIVEFTVMEHYVAGLEVTIKEIGAVGLQQIVYKTLEIIFEELLVERYVGEFEVVVLEIGEIPRH